MLAHHPGFKVVLLGNSGSGKTSILNYAVTGSPLSSPRPTIGCICSELQADNASGAPVRLNIWDTAGQELYQSIVPIYVRDAIAGLVVYDVTDVKSFQALDHWVSMLRGTENGDSIIVYVLGNKIDMNAATVGDDQGQLYAERVGGKFFRVSALEGTGIADVVRELATDLAGFVQRDNRDANNLKFDDRAGWGCC
jgi:small GTP-binding protein